jgi:hypothetical protein
MRDAQSAGLLHRHPLQNRWSAYLDSFGLPEVISSTERAQTQYLGSTRQA